MCQENISNLMLWPILIIISMTAMLLCIMKAILKDVTII